jgi:hypothetical protein
MHAHTESAARSMACASRVGKSDLLIAERLCRSDHHVQLRHKYAEILAQKAEPNTGYKGNATLAYQALNQPEGIGLPCVQLDFVKYDYDLANELHTHLHGISEDSFQATDGAAPQSVTALTGPTGGSSKRKRPAADQEGNDHPSEDPLGVAESLPLYSKRLRGGAALSTLVS